MERVKNIMIVFRIVIAVTIVIGLIACLISDTAAMVFVFLLFAEAFVDRIYTLVKWRCPCCGRTLPLHRFYLVDNCPYCDEELYY